MPVIPDQRHNNLFWRCSPLTESQIFLLVSATDCRPRVTDLVIYEDLRSEGGKGGKGGGSLFSPLTACMF